MRERIHVLLIEDSDAYANYIREELTLGSGAFSVSHADRISAAVELLRVGGIDVILLDLGLPDSDGLATVHRVVGAAGGVPIIVLSSRADPSLATATVQAGAQDCLIKTDIDSRILTRVIHYAIERRAAEARLRERDAHYRSIVEASLDAIISMDEAGRVREFNPAAEAMFGCSRAQALGRDLAELIMPERMRARHRAGLAHHRATGDERVIGRRLELVGMRADGSEFPVELTISKLSAATPIFTGFIRDLSERRRAEEAQQLALARIAEQASLLDKAQDAILVRDLRHRVTYYNKSAERIYGWTAEDVANGSVRERFFPDPGVFDRAMRELLRDGDWQGELSVIGRDGMRLTVESRWTLMRDASGAPRSVLVIDTDITERKSLEQRVLRAQRMESIGTLAGGIAHDLNNVLAPVLMSIELLKDEPSPEERRQILATIEASTRRGAEMVRQVLTFARGVEGERTAVDLTRLLADIEKFVRDTFMKAIGVQTVIADDLPAVLGDLTQLHQVLVNLCVNARDAMPTGGQLTLQASVEQLTERDVGPYPGARPGPYVVVRVTDTGEGIAPQALDRIFDPFFTSKPVGKGTGLGLSTSLAIIKSHAGFIQVDSEVGRGSAFTVYLPAQAGAPATAPAVAAPAPARGDGELILVVDDEEPVLRMAGLVLESFGYRVLLAASGDEAIALFTSHRDEIRVVFTDMTMPGLDGAAVISAIRACHTPARIVATSGLGAGQASNIAGVLHFVPKPYTADTLLKAIADAVRHHPHMGA